MTQAPPFPLPTPETNVWVAHLTAHRGFAFIASHRIEQQLDANRKQHGELLR